MPRKARRALHRMLQIMLRRFQFGIEYMAKAAEEMARGLARAAESFQRFRIEMLMQSAYIVRPASSFLVSVAY